MREFKHYIATRFNLGIFNPEHRMFRSIDNPKLPGISLSNDDWMRHRMNLFISFTLPSVMNQSNQDFTWIVLMDDMTPQVYRDVLSHIRYRNLKFVYIPFGKLDICKAVLGNTDSGDYDLITTRLDNDDALHKNAINDIQFAYLQENAAYSNPWVISMPHGCTLDLARQKMYITVYKNNANVSLVEDSCEAQTVWKYSHGAVTSKVKGVTIGPMPYWIIIVHSQNIANNTDSSIDRYVYTDKEVGLELLVEFGIDVSKIDALSKLTIEQMQNHPNKAAFQNQTPATIS